MAVISMLRRQNQEHNYKSLILLIIYEKKWWSRAHEFVLGLGHFINSTSPPV